MMAGRFAAFGAVVDVGKVALAGGEEKKYGLWAGGSGVGMKRG